MTTEERLLRLENSFNTLAELAAQSEARTATLTELMTQSQARTDMLVELVRGINERSETHTTWINELGAAQANSEHKIAALVDAQIKTEEALQRLTEKVDRLADARGNG